MNSIPVSVQSRTVTSFDGQPLFSQSWSHAHPQISLVFTHGLTGDSSAWELVIKPLMVRSEIPIACLAYDLRGHGFSSRHFPQNSVDLIRVFAQDLQQMMMSWQIDRPILVGQSLFGLIIQEYLRQQLLPVARHSVLITPVLATPPLSVSYRFWYQVLANSQIQPQPKRTIADHLRLQGSFDYSPSRIWSDIQANGWLNYVLLWGALFGHTQSSPTLLNRTNLTYIYGRRDLVVPQFVARGHLRQLPLVTAHRINSNHNAIINDPQEVVPILLEVIEKLSPTTGL